MLSHPRRGAVLSVSVTAAATLLTAACTSSTSSNSGAAPATSGGASPQPTQASSNKTIASFTYADNQWPTSLNGMTTKIQTAQISTLVTQPLERYSYKDGAGHFAANLAVSVRQPDSKTLVYTLRSGVKFSDGTPLTAQDVAWSITAAAAPTAETAGNMAGFKSATATGANQVSVKWSYPVPAASFRQTIAGTVEVQQAKFAKAHSKDLGTPNALPIGTGPYEYQSQTSQDITLVPNPSYWGTRPAVQKLVFTNITTDESAQLALRSGSIQGAGVVDLKTIPQWKGIDGSSLYIAHDPGTSFVSFDVKTPPFTDVHVRKAIAYSIDRKGVASAAFGGYADSLQAVIPIAGFSDVMPSLSAGQQFLDQLPAYNFDLAKAKAELAQSHYPNGFTTTVTYSSGETWEKVLLLSLQQNMKPLGVTINLKAVTPQAWFQTFFSHQATGMQVFPRAAILNGDPSALLPAMVGKASMKPNFLNNANFTTPTIEAAYPKLNPPTSGQYSKDQRWQALKTMLTEVANQVPYLPLFSPDTVYALAPGYVFTQTPTFADLISGAWIDYLKASS